LGETFENLRQRGLVLEENAAYHGRRVHKVWWPALRSVCYVDPETKLPVAIDNIELSYEEPPAGTFTIAIPDGYTLADGARESTLYATVELIQPAGTLVEIVNQDDVIRLVPTGPHSYEGDLDVKITCDTHVSWALSITAMGDVKGTYACWIDKFDLTPLGGIATVGVTLTEAEVADAPPQSKVATVHLQVTPRPDPMSDARALQTLGLALYDAKRYEEALATFERMEEQDNADQEDQAAAVIWQGHMLDLLGRREEAIARYGKVVGMGLSSALRQDPYGLHSEFTSYARERMTTPFTRVERSDDR
jgi:hypothetical protein